MPNSLTVHSSLLLVEEILSPWQGRIGADYDGYKNHVYRMLHCCFALAPDISDENQRKLTIAACHHDIGIWSEHTVDYLPPSIREAAKYLKAKQLSCWEEEVALLIDLHHKVRPIHGPLAQKYPLLEIFRRADLADFSLGLILGGVPAHFMQLLKRQFPNAGFHKMLMKASGCLVRSPSFVAAAIYEVVIGTGGMIEYERCQACVQSRKRGALMPALVGYPFPKPCGSAGQRTLGIDVIFISGGTPRR